MEPQVRRNPDPALNAPRWPVGMMGLLGGLITLEVVAERNEAHPTAALWAAWLVLGGIGWMVYLVWKHTQASRLKKVWLEAFVFFAVLGVIRVGGMMKFYYRGRDLAEAYGGWGNLLLKTHPGVGAAYFWQGPDWRASLFPIVFLNFTVTVLAAGSAVWLWYRKASFLSRSEGQPPAS